MALLEKQTGRARPLLEVIDNWATTVMCLRHPPFHDPSGRRWLYPRAASWHAMQLARSPSSPRTICMIGRCEHKGCRSLRGSWLACRHQHIGETKKSESAAAQSRPEGPVPGCLHPSSSSHSVTYTPAASLVFYLSSGKSTIGLLFVWGRNKQTNKQLNKWLIAAQRKGVQLRFLYRTHIYVATHLSFLILQELNTTLYF